VHQALGVREVIELFAQTGASLLLINCLELCVNLCATTRLWREAITVWAAFAAVRRATWIHGESQADDPAGEEFQEPPRKAREALGPALARAAEEHGAAMTPAAAAEYVLLPVTGDPGESAAAPDLPRLSTRERELVTLVAQGRTNAQIAAQLSISVRTVRSRLDRIRAKTGSQRRADLTRLPCRRTSSDQALRVDNRSLPRLARQDQLATGGSRCSRPLERSSRVCRSAWRVVNPRTSRASVAKAPWVGRRCIRRICQGRGCRRRRRQTVHLALGCCRAWWAPWSDPATCGVSA
jgi:DNA-binding CsgD family transcriptional regulator